MHFRGIHWRAALSVVLTVSLGIAAGFALLAENPIILHPAAISDSLPVSHTGAKIAVLEGLGLT
ncbi:MAG: hypothetical protein HYY09_05605 [Firmicutes bacterium]|nr:hypothetical protein [Bacillota bacterium]